MIVTTGQIVTGVITSVISAILVSLLAWAGNWATGGGLIKSLGGVTQEQLEDQTSGVPINWDTISWDVLIDQKQRPPSTEPIVPNSSTPWGDWEDPAYCPLNQYICGIAQKVEKEQGSGIKEDDTAMNGLRFYCCPL